eukprot:718448_1
MSVSCTEITKIWLESVAPDSQSIVEFMEIITSVFIIHWLLKITIVYFMDFNNFTKIGFLIVVYLYILNLIDVYIIWFNFIVKKAHVLLGEQYGTIEPLYTHALYAKYCKDIGAVCTICLDPFINNDTNDEIIKCGHRFHLKCLNEHEKSRGLETIYSRCPNCRLIYAQSQKCGYNKYMM